MLQALGDALFQKVSARWHARARALPRLLECNARVQVYAFVRRFGDSGDDEGEAELVALLKAHRMCVRSAPLLLSARIGPRSAVRLCNPSVFGRGVAWRGVT